jgi:hypothetical protein
MIEREAKLFEAGSYPDRGVEITEEDLDLMAANTADAPVRIEHTATPFDGALGVLKAVYRKGKELFGRLCFTSAAWELIKSANAKRLSVAIRKDKSAIAEVSLVREPRVADAAVFSGGEVITMSSDVNDQNVLSFDDLPEPKPPKQPFVDFSAADALIDSLKRAGKLVPAAEEFARAILTAGDDNLIKFGGESVSVSKVFRLFLEAQPKVIEFAELATASGAEAAEPEVFAKLGVTSQQVEKHRGR